MPTKTSVTLPPLSQSALDARKPLPVEMLLQGEACEDVPIVGKGRAVRAVRAARKRFTPNIMRGKFIALDDDWGVVAHHYQCPQCNHTTTFRSYAECESCGFSEDFNTWDEQ